jgi:histidyl-tRNA synthetase
MKKVCFAPLEDSLEILRLCRDQALALREAGMRPEIAHGVFSLSQHLKKANQLGLRFMVIIGPDEFRKKVVMVKDLEKREQVEVPIDEVVSFLSNAIACHPRML